jgi:hypothetical protein
MNDSYVIGATGCADDGKYQLKLLLSNIVLGALRCPNPGGGPCSDPNFALNQLINAFKTFECTLPNDIVNQINNESSSTISKVNLLYVVIIFSTLIILTIFIFLGMYLQQYLLFSILSVVLIILAAIILLFALNSIYKISSDNVSILLTNIQDAINNGYCCLGGGNCVTC